MPVNTNKIPPIIPGVVTVASAVSSANIAFDRIFDVSVLANKLEIDVGDKTKLKTDNKASLVGAINEIQESFLNGYLLENITGNLLDLTTTNRLTLVGAINELDQEVGDLRSLNTESKYSLVDAINEVSRSSANIGDLSLLSTSDRFSLVGAINEIYTSVGYIGNLTTGDPDLVSAVNNNFDKIGVMSSLMTVRKNSLVEAINELKVRADGFLKSDGSNVPTKDMDFGNKRLRRLGPATEDTDAVIRGQVVEIAKTGNISQLLTNSKTTLVASINELFTNTGPMLTLKTAEKTSIVGAINELFDNIGYSTKQDNLETVSGVEYGRGVGSDHNQIFDFHSSVSVSDYDFRIMRSAGNNGHTILDQRGTGYIYYGFSGVNRIRMRNDPNKPLQVLEGSNWVDVATGEKSLPLVGGTITGHLYVKSSSSNGFVKLVAQGNPGTGYLSGGFADGADAWRIGDTAVDGTNVNFHLMNSQLKGFKFHGDLEVTGTIVTPKDIQGLSASDEKLKSNVEPLTDALEVISSLEGFSYDMHGRRQSGLIAQKTQKVKEHLVSKLEVDGEEVLGVYYNQVIGYLVEAIKTLKKRIEVLEG